MHRRTSVTRALHGIDEPADAGLLFLRKATRPQESSPHLSGVRLERVSSIRAAIANGCYNVSSADLAQKLEVSRQSVNAIETGKYDPSLPLAFRIARLFGKRIEEIFEDG